MDAPPPVFQPSTLGPTPPAREHDLPSATQSFSEMTGMSPRGESPLSLIRSAMELLLRAAQASQRSGDMMMPTIIAKVLTELTEASTQSMAPEMPGASGSGMPQGMMGVPSMTSPQTAPPMLGTPRFQG